MPNFVLHDLNVVFDCTCSNANVSRTECSIQLLTFFIIPKQQDTKKKCGSAFYEVVKVVRKTIYYIIKKE